MTKEYETNAEKAKRKELEDKKIRRPTDSDKTKVTKKDPQ